MRSARKLLEEKEEAARAGVIDDVGFLETTADVDESVANVTFAREAYSRHRKERHGVSQA